MSISTLHTGSQGRIDAANVVGTTAHFQNLLAASLECEGPSVLVDIESTSLTTTSDIVSGTTITAGTDVVAAGDVTATAGSVIAGTNVVAAGDVTATAGSVTAGTNVVAAGDVTATAGSVNAGLDVIAARHVVATAGNVTAGTNVVATTGSVTAQTDVTATTGTVSGVGVSASGTLLVPVVDTSVVVGSVKGHVALDSDDDTLRFYNGSDWVSTAPLVHATSDLQLYVSSAGSDANDGLTTGTPFATLQHAIYEAVRIGYVSRATINIVGASFSLGASPNLYVPASVRNQTGSSIVISGSTTNLTPTTDVNIVSLVPFGPVDILGASVFTTVVTDAPAMPDTTSFGSDFVVLDATGTADTDVGQLMMSDLVNTVLQTDEPTVGLSSTNSTLTSASTLRVVRNTTVLNWNRTFTIGGTGDVIFRHLNIEFGDDGGSNNGTAIIVRDARYELAFESCHLRYVPGTIVVADSGTRQLMAGTILLTNCKIDQTPPADILAFGIGRRRHQSDLSVTVTRCQSAQPLSFMCNVVMLGVIVQREASAGPRQDAVVIFDNCGNTNVKNILVNGVFGANDPGVLTFRCGTHFIATSEVDGNGEVGSSGLLVDSGASLTMTGNVVVGDCADRCYDFRGGCAVTNTPSLQLHIQANGTATTAIEVRDGACASFVSAANLVGVQMTLNAATGITLSKRGSMILDTATWNLGIPAGTATVAEVNVGGPTATYLQAQARGTLAHYSDHVVGGGHSVLYVE